MSSKAIIEAAQPKPPVRIATCMPKQRYDREKKLLWLDQALVATQCDLFLTPQEYFGGHYVMKTDLHIERSWLMEKMSRMAQFHNKHIGVGACTKVAATAEQHGQGAMEDYFYIDSDGKCLGHHSKFALPSYDDNRTGGHGQLWPETDYGRRATPISLPKLRLKIGTVFCWEVFSQTLWASYSLARCNLIAHPIKFAPRGWLNNKKQADGKLHIVGFGNAPRSQIWIERLIMASKHQCMCPIAVSCNSWDLGPKMMALVGHVDEMRYVKNENNEKVTATELHDVPSNGFDEHIHVFEMVPEFYEGLDHHHSAGAFKAHVGNVEGFSEMGEWTMHGKIRRLEAQFLGGSTAKDCALKAQVEMRKTAASRQKKSVPARAFGKLQKVALPKRKQG